MVIVVDEYGNTAGLATMEDLLEVIIGEIRDEHEPDSDVTEDGQGGFIVSGNFDLDRIADLFDILPPRRGDRIHHRRRPGQRMAGPRAQAGRSGGPRRRAHRSAGQRRTARRAGAHRKSQTVAHE